MKNLLAIGMVSLFMGMTTISGLTPTADKDRSDNEAIRDRFAGAWRLAWLEQPGADGKLHRIDCCGMLVYTRDGHMSVQVMERSSETQASAYSQGGYEASYGGYEVDESAHTFTFHVEGALVRDLIGKDLPRLYEFTDNQLIVKSARPDEHWRVAWERY